MGQLQIQQLHSKALTLLQANSGQQPSNLPPSALISKLLAQVEDISEHPLTNQDIELHLLKYLETQAQTKPKGEPIKRRRSYELLHQEQKPMEESVSETPKISCLSDRHKLLEDKMGWIQQIEEQVRTNITELMATQKPYKIRQTFRRLILKMLNLDNLYLYVSHAQGKLQFHDFKNNYITEVLEPEQLQMMQRTLKMGREDTKDQEILELFDLVNQAEGKEELYKWNISKESHKMSICYLWKVHPHETCKTINHKIIQKIANVAMISSSEYENSIIQTYSKDLLEILELCINECETSTLIELGYGSVSMEDIERDLIRRDDDEMLLLRITVYQQLQFQLLERIRMYKKYVCEGDKIFMEFDQSAELTFLSRNFPHPFVAQLPRLWERKKLFIEKIFPSHKLISEFLKKASHKKVKPNKLYELDFESKIRFKCNEEGKIMRVNIIIEELETKSTGSSSNIYTSSTKILSDGSEGRSLKDIDKDEEKKRRPSNLVRNLEKDNPGIIHEGWINLFIKDDALAEPRKNTYFKGKSGRTYSAKRSISLNRSLEHIAEDSSQVKMRLQGINIESIDVNLLKLEQEVLQPLVLKVFRRMEYFHSQHINPEYFQNFLADVHSQYQIHNNPFHNFTHGVNVMHTCYLLVNSNRNKQILSPFKQFITVFSGLCHDIGHTGFNNLFEIASGSKKAITYNDNSPLENFHVASTFDLLKKPENNFLKDLSREELKEFRQSVIRNILFTDIKEHFPLLEKFKQLSKSQHTKNDESCNTLTSMIVHTADFGGSAKQFEIAKSWSLKVNLEFSNQYRMEGELGLPQTPFMKDLTNINTLSKNEGGFLKVIVLPLYVAMAEFCGSDLKIFHLREYVESNMQQWQKIHLDSSQVQEKPLQVKPQ